MNRIRIVNVSLSHVFLFGLVTLCLTWPTDSAAQDKGDEEFNRVRRIYIEGARFMQERRYADAAPMLRQAYTMLGRSITRGSKNKRVLRAHAKLRYFLGFSLYQVGKTKKESQQKEDKAFTRRHFKEAVPLLQTFIRHTKSDKRRQKSAKILAIMTIWLQKNPPPKIKPKIIKVAKQPKTRPIHPAGFVVLGVGVLTAGAGLATALLALNNVDQRDKIWQELQGATEPAANKVTSFHNQAETMATTSYILWGVGGGVAIAGVILIATLRSAPPKPPTNTTGKAKSSLSSRALPNHTVLLWKGGQP